MKLKSNIFHKLYKQVGFWNTMFILKEYRYIKEGIPTRSFYQILSKFSYYNAFLRVRKRMVKLRLIEWESRGMIKLTQKGEDLYDALTLIRERYLT